MRISAAALIAYSTFVIGVAAAPVYAEEFDVTLVATSGSVSYNPDSGQGTSPLYLYGDGFSFMGDPFIGDTGPNCCLSPGATTFLRANWAGDDLEGLVLYNHEAFLPLPGGPDVVDFVGSPFIMPNFDGSTAITLTSPFTMTGAFSGIDTTKTDRLNATLVGSGLGTVSFTWSPEISAWTPGIVTLQISNTGDAVPEPSSITLVCLSLMGAFAATRYRRVATQPR